MLTWSTIKGKRVSIVPVGSDGDGFDWKIDSPIKVNFWTQKPESQSLIFSILYAGAIGSYK